MNGVRAVEILHVTENGLPHKGLPFPHQPDQATLMAPLDSDDNFTSRETTGAQWCEVSERLAQATAKLCELEANVEDLKEANLRLRNELGVATLALFVTHPFGDK